MILVVRNSSALLKCINRLLNSVAEMKLDHGRVVEPVEVKTSTDEVTAKATYNGNYVFGFCRCVCSV